MISTTTNTNAENWSVIDLLLDRQQELTAIEKFAQLLERGAAPTQARHYRDLIPLTAPGEGQQYAFEVDLDSCSGCKSCVVACHNLNGLEDNELWRSVGLLHGGSDELPVMQHVTTACHHCIEPACLKGCPVEAYEKDPLTGIVRHLDDQCIGCQYCMLKCPYDVPRYSKSKGIVRKCDMCHDRLTGGEAPACVAACPNQAIRIKIVDQQQVIDESEANAFLPGAPEPSYTLPTTTYKSDKPLPRNLLPADYFSASPQHPHLPLVFMLVLTQMSVGAFVVEQLMPALGRLGSLSDGTRFVHLAAALLLGFLGLGASVFHLGRPFYAFRAWIGLRTSWLSREILAFGMFAMAATAYVAVAGMALAGLAVSTGVLTTLGLAAAAVGACGVACSVMIYVSTRRAFWHVGQTAVKFFGTALVLGLPLTLLISTVAASVSAESGVREMMGQYGRTLCQAVLVVGVAKLLFECAVFVRLRDRAFTPLRRTAMLMTGELGLVTIRRFFFGIVGGIALPGLLLAESYIAPAGFSEAFIAVVVVAIVGTMVIGELLERYLFFAAVVAPKMPGGA